MPPIRRSPTADENVRENVVKNENLYSLIGVDNSGDKKTNIFNPPPAPNTGVGTNVSTNARGTFHEIHWTDALEAILILSLVLFLIIKLKQCYNRMVNEREKRRQELLINQFKELNPFLTQYGQGGGGLTKPTPIQTASIQELPVSFPELNWETMLQPKH